jgi:hypothetical protein
MANWDSANFRKSSHSSSGGCVEVAYQDDLIGIRDTKNSTGPVLEFTEHEWKCFLKGVGAGEFDVKAMA